MGKRNWVRKLACFFLICFLVVSFGCEMPWNKADNITGNTGGTSNNFIVPTKLIIIDGNYNDWEDRERIYLDTDGQDNIISSGQDIKEIYIAQDDNFIYLRYILNGSLDKTFGYKFGNENRHIYVSQTNGDNNIFYANGVGLPQQSLPNNFVHIDGNQFECKFYKSDIKEWWKDKELAAWCDQGRETVSRDYISLPKIVFDFTTGM